MAEIVATWRLEQLDAAIEALSALARDATPLMEAVGLVLVKSARKRLGGTEGPDGALWPGLLPAYQRLREVMHPAAAGMLRVSGTLAKSLTFEVGPNYVRAGSPLIYAGVHQAGATIVAKQAPALAFALMGDDGHAYLHKVFSVHVPARPYLGIGAEEIAGIDEAFGRIVGGALAV